MSEWHESLTKYEREREGERERERARARERERERERERRVIRGIHARGSWTASAVSV